MRLPKVSILVPSYNRSGLLKKALNSIFQQTFTDFEVIVVDNCSTDDIGQLITSLDDCRLIYIRNDANIGAVNNYNKTLRLARGQYIYAFSDDDTMLDTDNLKIKVDIMDAHQSVGIVYSNYHIIDEQGEVIGENYFTNTPLLEKIIANPLLKAKDAFSILESGTNFVCMTSALLRGSVLKENHLEFNNQLRYLVDWNLWLHMSLFCDFYYVDKVLTGHRRHAQNESSLLKVEDCYNEQLLAKIGLITLFKNTGKLAQTDVANVFKSIQNPMSVKNTLIRNIKRVQNRLKRIVG